MNFAKKNFLQKNKKIFEKRYDMHVTNKQIHRNKNTVAFISEQSALVPNVKQLQFHNNLSGNKPV